MLRASFAVRLAGICGMLVTQIPAADADDGPTYCPALTRLAALVNAKKWFNTDQTEKNEHIVRLILFLRSSR